MQPGLRHLVAALGTEFRAGLDGGAAAVAFALRMQWFAAFGAEFGSLGARTAARAERHSFGGKIHILSEVDLLHLLLDLIDGGLRLCRCEFGGGIRSAIEAESAALVPAGIDAGPVGTLGTLPEIGFGFLDAFPKRLIMAGTLNRALDFVSGVSDASVTPPKMLLAARQCAAWPCRTADGLNSDMKPLPQRSQKNSNW